MEYGIPYFQKLSVRARKLYDRLSSLLPPPPPPSPPASSLVSSPAGSDASLWRNVDPYTPAHEVAATLGEVSSARYNLVNGNDGRSEYSPRLQSVLSPIYLGPTVILRFMATCPPSGQAADPITSTTASPALRSSSKPPESRRAVVLGKQSRGLPTASARLRLHPHSLVVAFCAGHSSIPRRFLFMSSRTVIAMVVTATRRLVLPPQPLCPHTQSQGRTSPATTPSW